MNTLTIVITMGGLGNRFRKAGYTIPKYMIEINEKSMFYLSLLSLSSLTPIAKQYIFIVLDDQSVDVCKFIKNECNKLNIHNYKIIKLNCLTDGQATTALLGSKYWQKDSPLLIYNIDTYIEPGHLVPDIFRGDGFIPCFTGIGNHWSFVKLNSKKEVVEVREKKRISDYCTIGAYFFKTCALYEELYNSYYKDNMNNINGEKYIAPLYNDLIKKGGKIFISNIPSKYVHVLGTPEELEQFKNK